MMMVSIEQYLIMHRKSLSNLPTAALTIFILGTIIYWMTNLFNSVRRYFILQGILILTGMVALAVGKWQEIEGDRGFEEMLFFEGSVIGVAAPSPEAAAALVVPVILPLFVFAGFFISTK